MDFSRHDAMNHEGVLCDPRMERVAILTCGDHYAALGIVERARHQEAPVRDAILYPLLVPGHPLASLGSIRAEP